MTNTNPGTPLSNGGPNTSHLTEVNILIDQLPSKSLSYPENAVIKYRTYSYGEIKKISGSTLSYKDVLNVMLAGIVTSFPKKDLTFFDLLYIGLLRRLSTIGTEKFNVKYKCSKCGNENTHTFTAQDINFAELEIPELPVRIDLDGKEVIFRPLTIKDFIELIDMKKSNDPLAVLSKQVRNMSFHESYGLLNRLKSYDDVEVINEVEELLNHGIEKLKVKCGFKLNSEVDETCDHDNFISLQGGQALLLPFRESKQPVKSRIQFGQKPSHSTDTPE